MNTIENNKELGTLTREFFMEHTGVYSTHSNFELIKLDFAESNLSPEAFCMQWMKDNESFIVNLSGQIKIDSCDVAMEPTALFSSDGEDITAIDVIESLSESEFYWKHKCEEIAKANKEVVVALKKMQTILQDVDKLSYITDIKTCKKRKFGQHGLQQLKQ